MRNKIEKLKKYLLFISIVFLVLPLTHLIYIYLYHDAHFIPIKGGSISEGLIGGLPTLNPLKNQKGNNQYIINLLYRSLLQYEPESKKIVSDIASCDISNLKYIECYLEENIKWSNGKEVDIHDILATYDILQNTEINPLIKSLLSETKIQGDKSIITFKNKKADINFLNVLFQPIVSKYVINKIGIENLKGYFSIIHGVGTTEGIYSGKYIITNISRDISIGATKLVLTRNKHYYNNPVITDRLILKLFSHSNNLIKNKESINVFNDTNHIFGESIARFQSQKYTLPQYVGLFINKNNIQNINLRTFLLNHIQKENLIKILGENKFISIKNPYLTEKSIQETSSNNNLEKILAEIGYYRKSTLLSNTTKINHVISDEAKINHITLTGTTKIDETLTGSIDIDKYQSDSEYIILPEFVDIYNFITKDNIFLKGVTPANTTAVHINDVEIVDFKEGSRYFYYKLKGKLSQGENKYSIEFTVNNERKLYEEIYFIYNPDKKLLEKNKTTFIQKLAQTEIQKLKNKQQNNADLDNDFSQKRDAIQKLDESSFYNSNLEKLSFNLLYILGEEHYEKTSIYIKNELEKIGIGIHLIPIQLNQLYQFIGENKNKYDLILTGIHLGYFSHNLFPYFHSSQAKGGYNFSNIRKTSLDIILEELKGNIVSENTIDNRTNKVLDILKKEQIVKTLYSPRITLLIDKKIKNARINESLPNKALRGKIFNKSYILDKKIIDPSNKSLFNFFIFIIEKING